MWLVVADSAVMVLSVALALHVMRPAADVSAMPFSLETQTYFACHVSYYNFFY